MFGSGQQTAFDDGRQFGGKSAAMTVGESGEKCGSRFPAGELNDSPVHGRERGVRSCTRNMPNYSDTHKGISPNQFKGRKSVNPHGEKPDDSAPVTDFDLAKQTIPFPKPLEAVKPLLKSEHELTVAAQASSPAEPKNRTGLKRSYQEICRTYSQMFSFKWDLKEIQGLKHPPGKFYPLL